MECCLEHSGHKEKLENLEDGLDRLYKSNTVAHQRIDGMKNWVIAGMTSLILQLLVLIGMFFMKAKGG